ADLAAFACEIAVEEVGDGGGDIEQGGDEAAGGAVVVDEVEHQGHDRHASHGQNVGQVGKLCAQIARWFLGGGHARRVRAEREGRKAGSGRWRGGWLGGGGRACQRSLARKCSRWRTMTASWPPSCVARLHRCPSMSLKARNGRAATGFSIIGLPLAARRKRAALSRLPARGATSAAGRSSASTRCSAAGAPFYGDSRSPGSDRHRVRNRDRVRDGGSGRVRDLR